MKNLIGDKISSKNIDKYLKYCNRYTLFTHFIGLIIVLPLVIYYRFYYDGKKYDIFSFIESFKTVENFRTRSKINLINDLTTDDKEVEKVRNLYILYLIGCLYLVGTVVDVYFRIFHKDNKYVKTWIGYTCFGDIISLLF